MTQEDKELLLKDLCGRLPYGVKVKSSRRKTDVTLSLDIMTDFHLGCNIKPYLRPISNMTEDESNELESILFPLMEKDWDGNENPACIRCIDIPKYMNFILSHHFDYRGLISMGLALEAPEGMYKEAEK